mgnify:CR=1 FL=1|tara:strand:- start:615 stop:971 length:357 start_codon:yes stop_codon:yes gene_type:complete
MKIDSIRVGYVDVPICLEDLHEDDCFGYFEAYPKPKIGLHRDMSPLYMAATGLHEVIEAISAIYGLDLAEGQVRTLETVMVEIVRSNPEQIRQWLDILTNENPNPQGICATRSPPSEG